MSTTTLDRIMRLRELAEQTGNAMAAGLIDDIGDPELCEMADLIHELDQGGALVVPIESAQVVNVDRDDGIYVFADLDDAMAFEATVNGDRDTSMGLVCYRTEEVICDHAAALQAIAAECEASEEAEAASLESGIPVATYAWRKGEDAPYPDKLQAIEYTVHQTASKIVLWVGLHPDSGSVNVDAGRERLEAEGWEVTDWGAA